MQIEFDAGYRTFKSIPNNSVFIWETNGKVYAKRNYESAIDLEAQTEEGFDPADKVLPCVITKLFLESK